MDNVNNDNNLNLKVIPYTATSVSVIARFIFMYLLYKNKSTNSLSLIFCGLNILSSGMWIYYSVLSNDLPLIFRSSADLTLLFLSSLYIIRNKIKNIVPETNTINTINTIESIEYIN
jgi:uncharacterized protein with PQ loop repeat